MLENFEGRYGLRFAQLNPKHSIDSSKFSGLEKYLNKLCQEYGASCKFFTPYKYHHTDETECYVAFSIFKIPDDLDVKKIYIRNNRSCVLFYTDCDVFRLSEYADLLSLFNSAHQYCKTADFLRQIFKEFNTPLPRVICGSEIGGLKEYNMGRLNLHIPAEARTTYEKALIKYFKQERAKSKYVQKWRAFSRTDMFDRKASTIKMFWDFYHRNNQIISLALLRESNDQLFTTDINDHEYRKFKKEIARLFPDVLYSISKIEVENEGFIRLNKNKPIKKFKNGPFGKLITYEAYCEEREKKFASEGYDALKDLTPAYFETRQLTYKAIDEPFIAQVLNKIRFAYAKSSSLSKVQLHGTDLVYIVDIPTDDMMNFVSLATANHVPYHIDFTGRFSCPNFEKLCIVYNPMDFDMMRGILDRIVSEKFEYDHVETTLNKNKGTILSVRGTQNK